MRLRVLRLGALGALLVLLSSPARAWPPEAKPLSVYFAAGTIELPIDLLAHSSDRDGDPLGCQFPPTTQANGTLQGGPSSDGCVVLYRPPTTTWSSDQFTYTITDGASATQAIVTISKNQLVPTSSPPSGLLAVSLSPTSIRLAWVDRSLSETATRVHAKLASAATFQVLIDLGGLAGTGSREWVHQGTGGPTPGSTWQYKIETCEASSCAFSNTAQATTPSGPVNTAPQATDDRFSVFRGSSLLIPFVQLLDNDSDGELGSGGNGLTITSPAGHNALQYGTLTRQSTGFLYQQTSLNLPSGEVADHFTYTVSDGQLSDSAEVVLDLVVPTAPTAQPDSFTTTEGVPLYIWFSELTSNDGGEAFVENLWAFTRPSSGKLDFCCHPFTVPDGYTNELNHPFGVWFVPDEGFIGQSTFVYGISNSAGHSSAEVTVTVNAAGPVPDPTRAFSKFYLRAHTLGAVDPDGKSRSVWTFSDFKRGFWANPPEGLADEGDALQFRLAITDPLTPTHRSSQWLLPGLSMVPGSSAFAPADYEGAYVLEIQRDPPPPASPLSSGPRSFTYAIKGADGLTAQATASIRLDDRPFQAVDDFQSWNPVCASGTPTHFVVPEGARLPINAGQLLRNDQWPNRPACIDDLVSSPLMTTRIGYPYRGSFPSIPKPGGITYQAPRDYVGVDYFTYTIEDPMSTYESMAKVVIQVVPGMPGANADSFVLIDGDTLRMEPLANDTDPQGNAALRILSITPPLFGVALLDADGKHIAYRAPDGSDVNDHFTYTIQDADGNTSTADIVVVLNFMAPPPQPED